MEHTFEMHAGTRSGSKSRTVTIRRMINMFYKPKHGRMLESRFDDSIKEGCCCYLCASYRKLN